MSAPVRLCDADHEGGREIARMRKKPGGARVWASDYDELGGMGELAWQGATGLAADLTRRPGDGGVDFRCGRWLIAVKTTRRYARFNLLVDPEKPECDVYVLLAWHPEDDGIWAYGWATAAEVRAASIVKIRPNNYQGREEDLPLNHAIPMDQLRPIATLLESIERARRGAA